jgi:hypothetical protein
MDLSESGGVWTAETALFPPNIKARESETGIAWVSMAANMDCGDRRYKRLPVAFGIIHSFNR